MGHGRKSMFLTELALVIIVGTMVINHFFVPLAKPVYNTLIIGAIVLEVVAFIGMRRSDKDDKRFK